MPLQTQNKAQDAGHERQKFWQMVPACRDGMCKGLQSSRVEQQQQGGLWQVARQRRRGGGEALLLPMATPGHLSKCKLCLQEMRQL